MDTQLHDNGGITKGYLGECTWCGEEVETFSHEVCPALEYADGNCITSPLPAPVATTPAQPLQDRYRRDFKSNQQRVNNENILANARRQRRFGKSMWDR